MILLIILVITLWLLLGWMTSLYIGVASGGNCWTYPRIICHLIFAPFAAVYWSLDAVNWRSGKDNSH